MPEDIFLTLGFPEVVAFYNEGKTFEVWEGYDFSDDRAFRNAKVYLRFRGSRLKSFLNRLTRKPIAEIIEGDLVRIFDSDWAEVLKDLATQYEERMNRKLTLDHRSIRE